MPSKTITGCTRQQGWFCLPLKKRISLSGKKAACLDSVLHPHLKFLSITTITTHWKVSFWVQHQSVVLSTRMAITLNFLPLLVARISWEQPFRGTNFWTPRSVRIVCDTSSISTHHRIIRNKHLATQEIWNWSVRPFWSLLHFFPAMVDNRKKAKQAIFRPVFEISILSAQCFRFVGKNQQVFSFHWTYALSQIFFLFNMKRTWIVFCWLIYSVCLREPVDSIPILSWLQVPLRTGFHKVDARITWPLFLDKVRQGVIRGQENDTEHQEIESSMSLAAYCPHCSTESACDALELQSSVDSWCSCTVWSWLPMHLRKTENDLKCSWWPLFVVAWMTEISVYPWIDCSGPTPQQFGTNEVFSLDAGGHNSWKANLCESYLLRISFCFLLLMAAMQEINQGIAP